MKSRVIQTSKISFLPIVRGFPKTTVNASLQIKPNSKSDSPQIVEHIIVLNHYFLLMVLLEKPGTYYLKS